jgi:flagellar protein FliS
MNYQEQALSGATGVELIVALYDGWIRFLYRAAAACDADDVIERRYAVKRALDILMYLEARLRPDIGGEPARALSDFYAAMFTMTLESSHSG